ncbi:site-specific integrase [Oceanimonas smirnovii]|uniref:Site-specific integrase n=1 Tax=Oceanimonas smirnovii TaxID=264574 RepID=A0ABW7NZ95_9GAMM
MSVRKLPTGKWLAQVFPEGRAGRRVRRQFITKGEAMAFERFLLEPNQDRPWMDDGQNDGDTRRLMDLVEAWFNLHGQSLSDGERRRTKLLNVCEALGNPVATDFTARDFAAYREARLSGQLPNLRATQQEGKGVSPTTVNREHSYLRAVFNELKRLGEWQEDNPLDGVRAFKVAESELAFLYEVELKRLLCSCAESSNQDLLMVVKLCLATGARWSEVERLQQSQVSPHRITFTRTKSNKNRTIPISRELFAQLPRRRGRLFGDCYRAFEAALDKAEITLPEGQCTHVLRHTFASHFMMNGGNILVLQKILGHSTINMTMRYAHFAPDHLEDAVKMNPLAAAGLQ